MQAFDFTAKKLSSLTPKRRAKQIAIWLRRCYLELLEEENLNYDYFKESYQQLRKLETYPEFTFPESTQQKIWLEFLADQYHHWLEQTEIKLHEEDFLPQVPWGDDLEAGPWVAKYDYFVALDQVRSAFNVGSICRTIDSLGFAGLITTGITPALGHIKVKKSAMGSQTWIPEIRVDDLSEKLVTMKSEGYQIIGVEKAEGAISLEKMTWPTKAVLVMGNEEYGISSTLMPLLDQMVVLPMQGRKNSLNVANAFAAVGFTAMMSFTGELC